VASYDMFSSPQLKLKEYLSACCDWDSLFLSNVLSSIKRPDH